MRIDTPDPKPRTSGDYDIYVTSGYGSPTADIFLDEKGDLRLQWLDEGDCERLIRAAARALEEIRAYAAEMAVPHGRRRLYKGTCQLCGKPEDDDLHREPQDAAGADAAHKGSPDDAPIDLWPSLYGPHKGSGTLKPCRSVSDRGTPCTSPVPLHPMPHRDADGSEWDDSAQTDGAPHYVVTLRCGDKLLIPADRAYAYQPGSRAICTGHGMQDIVPAETLAAAPQNGA